MSGIAARRGWICSQIGAREQYAIARGLYQKKVLEWLLTDAWVSRANPLGLFRQSLRERYHAAVANDCVMSWNSSLVAFELAARMKGLSGWPLIIARNKWFQRKVANYLVSYSLSVNGDQRILFSYSYAALDPFRFAKSRGWKTVLGQIDPGPALDRIGKSLADAAGIHHFSPPSSYWDEWHQECDLADKIVVNSDWSRKCLMEEGIDPVKIKIIPLSYEPPPETEHFHREIPSRFTSERPLRVLFLAQITLTKGTLPLLEAAQRMRGRPVEFMMVGPVQVDLPANYRDLENVQWFGAVPRSETSRFFKEADAFIFPTFCDGFGLTQLEAQAWKLPVFASRFCGEVVSHGHNGLILNEVSEENICQMILSILERPEELASLAEHSSIGDGYSTSGIASKLLLLASHL